ncbi:MAG: amino acid ABC transporter permease [Lachnospiraceae bacterium]|nr:amino acid ABC transporter permease [Lachnospiraceae bacterium]
MGSYRVFEPSFIWYAIGKILPYIGVTFAVVITTLIVSILFGALLARAKIRGKWGKVIADGYTAVFRCIPSIVLIYLVYYGLPQFVEHFTGVDINNWNKGIFIVLAFSLSFSAFISEIMRAAYDSVDAIQHEAALSIGLTETQAFWRIIFPQAVRFALPNIANIITSLMKEGALAYTIGLIDMMGAGKNIINMNYGSYTLETYLGLFIIYWVLTKTIEILFAQIEKQLSKGRKTIAG